MSSLNSSDRWIITDERAEGLPDPIDDAPPPPFQSIGLPPERLPRVGGPSGETGMMPAVMLAAEGADQTELQDASRTTAETHAVTLTQPVVAASAAPRVLIVEDDTAIAEIIAATLQQLRLVIAVEHNAVRALARYPEFQPDLVILDLGLPDTNGWKLLETIKEQNADGVLPNVIVITALADAANRLVGKLQNVHTYIVKPFTVDELISVVTQALGGRVG